MRIANIRAEKVSHPDGCDVFSSIEVASARLSKETFREAFGDIDLPAKLEEHLTNIHKVGIRSDDIIAVHPNPTFQLSQKGVG
jgi:hypothetical protein